MITVIDETHAAVAALVGKGLMFALSDARGLIGHREPNNELCVYVAFKFSADSLGLPMSRDGLHEQFAGWHDNFHEILANGEGDLMPRPISALPIGHRWPRSAGVTLMGDAAHLMSPFAGEGVNMAMTDGSELATAIVENPDDLERAFAVYEAAMFARAETKAAESAAGLELAFAANSPQGMLDFFGAHKSPTLLTN